MEDGQQDKEDQNDKDSRKVAMEDDNKEEVFATDVEDANDDDHPSDDLEEQAEYHSDDSRDPEPEAMTTSFEPSYRKANSLHFFSICKRLNYLARFLKEKPKKKTWDKKQKLEFLLPPQILRRISPGSVFPLFRLLMPGRDSSLKVFTKEPTLATAYCDALSLDKDSSVGKVLRNFTDPMVCGGEYSDVVGDFSCVLERVLEKRLPKNPNKDNPVTVGDINKILDGLTRDLTGTGTKPSNHDWRSSQSQGFSAKSKTKKPPSKAKIREKWIKKAMDQYRLTPLEHKWLVRIILDNIKIGIGWESILSWYSKHAMELYSAHNNLKSVCNKLCNPAYIQQREREKKEAEERLRQQRFTQLYDFPTDPDPVFLGNTISAMKSERTSFESLMADMQKKHALVMKKKLEKDDPLKKSLALNFPAFVAEVKLDGERMIVHINRGKVTMHTRQGRWYSPPYSPIVGPALRRAISNYDVDVILDGEVLAWDNRRQWNVDFGSNRSVAILRRKWLAAHGKLEKIDLDLHEGEEDDYIMRYKDIVTYEKEEDKAALEGTTGDACWLKYVAFDILYVGGPDADKVLSEALPMTEEQEQQQRRQPGSTIHLSGFERKRILYCLIEPLKNEVEIVQSVVIRPTGDCAKGGDYFSVDSPARDCGAHAAYNLDSAKWTLNVGHPSLEELDEERRKGRGDLVISRRRTAFVNQFYHAIVDQQKMEGIVVKDLAAPYILKRRTGLWLKIKPDYSNNAFSSDIDVVVIGGSFATGCSRAGEISGFLCACIDSEDPKKFFTFCRVAAKTLKDGKLDELMRHTGFKKATSESSVSFGKWFTEHEHGKTLPEFISMRSFQIGQEGRKGWKFDRVQNYPDLFIHPDDSVVLTLNSSEIVRSDEYSAGITLRFPRATRLRLGEDEKPVEDIENEEQLYRMYRQYKDKMRQFAVSDSAGFDPISPSKSAKIAESESICQFLTVEQYLRTQRSAEDKRRKQRIGRVQRLIVSEQKDSKALAGLKFFVFEGHFALSQHDLDSADAKDEGWFEEACQVRSAMDVMAFIARNGGTVVRTPDRDAYLVGGNTVTQRVKCNIQALEECLDKDSKRRKKEDEPVTCETIKVPGVLRWTYVFSIVHRWFNKRKRGKIGPESGTDEDDNGDSDDDDGECIKKTDPELLVPRFFDFLAQSEAYSENPFESIWKVGHMDKVGMRRALIFIEDSNDTRLHKRSKKELPVPWQYAAYDALPAQDRWIMSCQYQTLWPYPVPTDGSYENRSDTMVVYPDLFDDYGSESEHVARRDDLMGIKSNRWEQADPDFVMSGISSSVPLLRAMGCLVTSHLHTGVTHVLCDLKDDVQIAIWRQGKTLDVFTDVSRGRRLLERLNEVKEEETTPEVRLVSRRWVGSLWNS